MNDEAGYRKAPATPGLLNKWSQIVFADFALQNMFKITLPDGLETSGQRPY